MLFTLGLIIGWLAGVAAMCWWEVQKRQAYYD